MKTVYHAADSRGHARHGWLETYHTFSFAGYMNPNRMNFGTLRVLNDDVIAGGQGFGMHPHQNMEIISIPLSGYIQHRDNQGGEGMITRGQIQVMSAGTGVMHSEFNGHADQPAELLQIWVIPNRKGVPPRYEDLQLNLKPNQLNQIISPNPEDEGGWIHQDAWFSLGEYSEETVFDYSVRKAGNGVYIFIIEGSAAVGEQPLNRRDGLGIWEADSFQIKVMPGTTVLLMEVPM